MVRLVPMTEKDFEPFMDLSMKDQAQGQVQAGVWTAEEAVENIKRLRSQFLPDGLQTAGQHFLMIEDAGDGETVGVLWYMITEENGKRFIYVMDIQVYDHFRRKGYGSQAFIAMEETARGLGIDTISLHVFKDNHPARAMYRKLGYAGTDTAMSKKIDL